MEEFLKSSINVDYESQVIQEYIEEFRNLPSKSEMAVKLYYKIRDGFLYDPFHLDISPQVLIASKIVPKKRAWCVEKALLMVAGSRALGIPSRFGFAIVTNHLGADKLEKYLKRSEIVFHGFASLFLDSKWVNCTPAFDTRVCRLSGVKALEWDGKSDSLFHEFEGQKQFMEYKKYYGFFSEIPFELMHLEMKSYYPHLFEFNWSSKSFSFDYDENCVVD
jgi:transglutaminase-like putative cysteine protease